jgi:hypothetical protein
VTIIANLPVIVAAAVLICSVIVASLDPDHARVQLFASVLGLAIGGPLALAAWACLWWTTQFLVKKPPTERAAAVENAAAAPAVDGVSTAEVSEQ